MEPYGKIAQYAIEGWRWAWANKMPIIIVALVIAFSIAYSCERRDKNSIQASLDAEKTKSALLMKSVEEMKVANDTLSKALQIKQNELKITADALAAQAQVQAQTEQTKKDADDILKKISSTTDVDEWSKLEAEYWNKIYGFSAAVDPKTKKAMLLKISPQIKKIVVKVAPIKLK